MTADQGWARRFVLRRVEDASGVSGVGDVAEGVQFSDGTAVLRWRTARSSTATYDSIEDVEAIHGHGGRTLIVWLDGCKNYAAPPPCCRWHSRTCAPSEVCCRFCVEVEHPGHASGAAEAACD